MNQSVRTFTLTGLVAAGLLLMHELPPLSIGGTALRHVNILSQLLPERMSEQPDVVPAPKVPRSVVAKNKQGKAVAFKEVWPKGVEPIADFSAGKAGGMDAFYAKLSEVKQLDRPVRIAYFGDSFIEGDILTSNLRELFQQRFGGSGVGWVDCGTPLSAFRRTVKQQYRGVREFSVVKKPFDKQRQGIAQRYYGRAGHHAGFRSASLCGLVAVCTIVSAQSAVHSSHRRSQRPASLGASDTAVGWGADD